MSFMLNLWRRDDRPLQFLAVGVGLGLFVLLAGLWFVQIAFASRFENNLRKQSFRTVAIAPVRGKILDRNGRALAENRPRYNADLYLEGLQRQFDDQYASLSAAYRQRMPAVAAGGKHPALKAAVRRQLQLAADCDVVGGISAQVTAALNEPTSFDTNRFLKHYTEYPYVPYPILSDLTPRQVAIFAEQFSGQSSIELETQPVRFYPYGTTAAHLLGFVQRKDPEASFRYSLPNYEGRSGIEKMFDDALRGQTGVKSVLVNNLSYRQREEIDSPSEPGDDVYLTIDLNVQRTAEAALASAIANVRGAAVVLDIRNGDILAMASSPTFDPNNFIPAPTPAEWERLNNPELSPQLNRAIGGAFAPGSTFKIVTAIACLENGLNPNEIFDSPGAYQAPGTRHVIADTAGPGKFDFNRAFYRSSNTYFIEKGIKYAGLRKLLEVARRFHLGEKTRLGPQEVAGYVPAPSEASQAALQHSLADVCIGQEITVSPLQMAVFTAAIANGGVLFWPRVVEKLHHVDSDTYEELVAPGRIRDHVAINPEHLALIRHAMVQDTEVSDPLLGNGTAFDAFHNRQDKSPLLPGFRVAGKTGTAEVKGSDRTPYKTTWFVSYGPFENPRYAVVVMVDHGISGGLSCAPAAEKIYAALLKMEQGGGPARGMVAAMSGRN
ncbi:MAG TPA: penicillin-binding transpeptidase domain-containing protein [Verrucomicrobiae bacterium]|jgi:penicillin-binding protein 2|nr:penicillin-binding transpeptidase domain-containing protein [Verrucomicrobiae bacterium]